MYSRIIVLSLFYLWSLSAWGQCRWILIEHLGSADYSFPDVCILDGLDCEDPFSSKHSNLHYLSNAIDQKKSFNLLAKEFQLINESVITEGDSRLGNLRITMYDEKDSLVFRRYLCCRVEAYNYFHDLSCRKKIKKDVELSSLFRLMTGFLETNDVQ